ncbi:ArsR family transcriptional regulator [Enterococcus faecium]|uniref:ArsR family transcriptional regulator n=1 Tax=Enterococcus faecium TaxID=1352 RepID=UPI00338EED64
MNPLLYNYFVDKNQENSVDITILCLLHELRIISRTQLIKLLALDFSLTIKSIDRHIRKLFTQEMIEKLSHGKQVCYYLSKKGHDSIGGHYTLPKVPEYNLNHHLAINDYLIKTLKVVYKHPNLKFVLSERRQVFETKDLAKNNKGKKYFVPDFILRFRDKDGYEINWSFEIELTMKTRRRYWQGIFPKYIRELKENPSSRLIYVTPSPLIKEELERFRRLFIQKEGAGSSAIFQRLHVCSSTEFEEKFLDFFKTDTLINWK